MIKKLSSKCCGRISWIFLFFFFHFGSIDGNTCSAIFVYNLTYGFLVENSILIFIFTNVYLCLLPKFCKSGAHLKILRFIVAEKEIC